MPTNSPPGPVSWSSITRRGLVAVAASLVTLAGQGRTFRSVVALVVTYALVDGTLAIAGAAQAAAADQPWMAFAIEGLAGVSPAVLVGIWPGASLASLLWMTAAWATVTAASTLITATRFRRRLTGEWLLALAGVVSMRFGVLMLGAVSCGALAIASWAGGNVCAFAAIVVALGLRPEVSKDMVRIANIAHLRIR
jgi:uncharacterized membrane protein HdeD (DUF308 family)